jgi:imidazolonepropionase-like amidohydrolase
LEKQRLRQWLIALNLVGLLLAGCGTSLPKHKPAFKLTTTPSLISATTLDHSAQKMDTTSLALVHGTLIDGTGAEPVVEAVIVIRDGRISEVGTSGEVIVPPDAEVIDVHGRTILPGFIDAHVHLAFEAENLIAWAQAGVTTVRDVGSATLSTILWDEWAHATHEGIEPPNLALFNDRDTKLNRLQYARIVAAGPILTVPRGYPITIHGKHLALSVTSPDDARQKIHILLDAGADLIKIAIESRWGLQQMRLSIEEVEVIVAVAHSRDTIVTAHVGLAQDLAIGVEAGIDDAAHMVSDRLPDELINQMIAKDIYIVPTLAVKGGLWVARCHC